MVAGVNVYAAWDHLLVGYTSKSSGWNLNSNGLSWPGEGGWGSEWNTRGSFFHEMIILLQSVNVIWSRCFRRAMFFFLPMVKLHLFGLRGALYSFCTPTGWWLLLQTILFPFFCMNSSKLLCMYHLTNGEWQGNFGGVSRCRFTGC